MRRLDMASEEPNMASEELCFDQRPRPRSSRCGQTFSDIFTKPLCGRRFRYKRVKVLGHYNADGSVEC